MKFLTKQYDFNFKETAVALGNFDGIHNGHQLLFEEINKSKESGLTSVVLTFDPHPSFILQHKEPVDIIYVREERQHKYDEMGVDVVIEYPYTEHTANMSSEEFVKNILVKQLGAKKIVVGKDYRFGKNRTGNVEVLKRFGSIYDFDVVVIEKKKYNDKIVSSSNIRELIKQGCIEEANILLGSEFFICGTVTYGKQLGAKLGIPTANIIPCKEKILPPKGVYMSRTTVNGQVYNSVTNIGNTPTVGVIKDVVETNIFDFDKNIYDTVIRVELVKFIRKEIKFNSIEDLIFQMNQDIRATKSYFLVNS